MKIIITFLILLYSITGYSQINSSQNEIKKVFQLYSEGEYLEVINELKKIENNIQTYQKSRQDILGFIAYWKAISFSKINEFDNAIKFFKKAIELGYRADNLYYEYGQALYTSLKLKEARLAFKQSVKDKYKRGVSLYYIATISKELKDYKTAVSFYEAIEKLPESERKDIIQAALMQVGEIYYEQLQGRKDAFRAVQDYVLPQFEKALKLDPESKLAAEINQKIEQIQKRYDLLLFYLRNGRPTARPPYFFKHNYTLASDSNVNLLSEDEKKNLSPEEYQALASTYSFFGRYSFYPSSAYSIVPQINAGITKYHSDIDNIKRNNNIFITTTLQTTYEHTFNKKAATTFVDLDYTYFMDNQSLQDTYEKASDGFGVTISEQLQFIENNPTIFRLRLNQTQSANELFDRETYGVAVEQMINMNKYIWYFTAGVSQNTFAQLEEESHLSKDLRVDLIFSNGFNKINPNLYASVSQLEFLNSSETDTRTLYGINLSRSLGKNWFVYLDYSRTENTSTTNLNLYEQERISFSLDYIY